MANSTEAPEVETVKTRSKVKSEDREPSDRVQKMVSLPAELAAMVEKEAEESGLGFATIARLALAERYNYILPPTERKKRISKYATDEEREAAQKQRNAARNDTIKALLKEFRAGNIQLSPEVMASLGADTGDDDDGDDDDE